MPIAIAKKVSPVKALFAKLDAAIEAAAEHRRKHRSVYDKGSDLDDQVETLQKQVKTLLAADYFGKPSGEQTVHHSDFTMVTVQSKNRRIFDHERMLKEKRELLEEIEGAIVLVEATEEHEVVSLEALDKAVRAKILPKAIVDEYVTAGEAMTPAVSFKQPQPKKEPE